MKNKFYPLLLMGSLIVTSCDNLPLPTVPIETDEAMVQAIHTAAAETITASMPTHTNTPRPTFTDAPTGTPFPTFTPDPILILTESVTATNTLSPAEYCENLQFWADVQVGYGEMIVYDTNFTKTWAFKNIGTCPIGSGYVLTYYSGDDFGEHKGKLKTTTKTGETGQVSVAMKAPHKPGT